MFFHTIKNTLISPLLKDCRLPPPCTSAVVYYIAVTLHVVPKTVHITSAASACPQISLLDVGDLYLLICNCKFWTNTGSCAETKCLHMSEKHAAEHLTCTCCCLQAQQQGLLILAENMPSDTAAIQNRSSSQIYLYPLISPRAPRLNFTSIITVT